MNLQRHFIFWVLISALLLIFVFIFKAVLLPFVIGIAVAYFLNPWVTALARVRGFERGLSALCILLGFYSILFLALGVLAPILYKEIKAFSVDIPLYVESILTFLDPLSRQLQELLGLENGDDFKALLASHAGTALNAGQLLAGKLAAGGQAFVAMLSVFVLSPIVAYFMMKEWVYITQWISDLMPRRSETTIKALLKEIDEKLSGFVRGQIMVAVMLGGIYALALSLLGLKYGFLIGLLSGFLSIVPMVGSVIGLMIGVVIAWFQAGELSFVAMVAGIFLAGQILEGNFLTPKLVGDRVGLHPLWVFFSLMAGGAVLGIVGMLLAVPVAAVVSVLITFTLKLYKGSSYYVGQVPESSDLKEALNPPSEDGE